ncbi:NmrA family NAD(P)-binding protein [Nocardia inohanensis]|uniref:NmrA family NAD(P)-binding protein n=1 Tax=Nocardia inohanensis TaxID=209246 RepID=UPI0008332CBC|nr:NmrA family NAD(P)-binding protein [Nocardia inohanensis]
MSVQSDLVLVTGATGKQGGATARQLLAAGRRVRVLVRDPEAVAAQELRAAGAELAVGDFDDAASVEAAVAGAGALFLVPPATYGPTGWDAELEAERGERMVAAAKAAGVKTIVFTGIASFKREGVWGVHGKRRIEDAVRAGGSQWTILRPVRFMENYLFQGTPVDGIRDGDVHLHVFPGDRPLQVIAVGDVAAFAVAAFEEPAKFHGRVLELAGDDPTPVAAAAAISAAVGRRIHYRELAEADAIALGEQMHQVWKMSRADEGWHADIPALRELLPGLRTFDEWLAESGAARIKEVLK